jgi:Spy/CpxP family protein refolding chaperone
MLVSLRRFVGSALLPASIFVAISVAQAQQPPAGKTGQGMMAMGPMGMMHGPALDSRLDHIRAQLGVTDAQSTAWNAYAGAVKARMSAMEGMRESMKQAMRSGTAVARMDGHIKAMEGMTESLKALKPATEAFYAVLTPEQKQKADALLGTGAMMCTFNTP